MAAPIRNKGPGAAPYVHSLLSNRLCLPWPLNRRHLLHTLTIWRCLEHHRTHRARPIQLQSTPEHKLRAWERSTKARLTLHRSQPQLTPDRRGSRPRRSSLDLRTESQARLDDAKQAVWPHRQIVRLRRVAAPASAETCRRPEGRTEGALQARGGVPRRGVAA